MNVFIAELHKSRRRYHTLVSLGTALAALLWAAQSGSGKAESLRCGYSILFYAMPVINAVVMPISTAALASRIWDIENQENNCRLLFTLQSRSALFAAKAALGLAYLALIALAEGAGVLVLGAVSGYTETLAPAQLIWLTLCTFAVSAMLFFLWLLPSIRFGNQTATLAAGTVGSLSGLFSAFMPVQVSRLIPWGYYIPLSAMAMDWNPETDVVRYFPLAYPIGMLCVTLALLALFACTAWRALERKEV